MAVLLRRQPARLYRGAGGRSGSRSAAGRFRWRADGGGRGEWTPLPVTERRDRAGTGPAPQPETGAAALTAGSGASLQGNFCCAGSVTAPGRVRRERIGVAEFGQSPASCTYRSG